MNQEEYLTAWTRKKTGIPEGHPMTRAGLEAYQLDRIRETLLLAKAGSPFYRKRLDHIDPNRDIACLNDMEKIPLTSSEDLIFHGSEMLCVRQDEISRIVTMETSGTKGNPKRVYFTEEDQELTTDYFHAGLYHMSEPGDVALILLPCRTPGSVGDLFRIGAERRGMVPIPYGPPGMREQLSGNKSKVRAELFSEEMDELLLLMAEKKVCFILGTSEQVKTLADHWSRKIEEARQRRDAEEEKHLAQIKSCIRNVLLTADYVSAEQRETIEKAWNCRIFEHYGMTEMGLGCAVSCSALDGCHVREYDLFLEIVDPVSGKVLPEGEYGEIVFTTLTRRGMPFIRYRTGDFTRWIPEPCACGGILKRIERVGDFIRRK